MERQVFARLVRQVLPHLYEQAYLQCHPLAGALVPSASREAAGQALHRLLLEAIGTLRPPPRVPPTAAAWRPYLALSLRYIEGMGRDEAAQELGFSPRQFRREQSKGLAALTDLLWARYQNAQDPAAEPGLPRSLLDAEVDRLGTVSPAAGTSLSGVFEGVLSILEGTLSRQQTSIAAALPPTLPPVAMERVALRQALLGVISHIVEGQVGVSVEIAARLAGREVELTIRRRGGQPASPSVRGVDERLEVATRLLETQGGRMDRGTGQDTIRLSLPVEQPATVLVVDDNPDVIRLFHRYLGGSPYRAVGATSGQEALRLAQSTRPQVITLDVMMAGQDGWDLLQCLKSEPATKDIPVIVCSVLREHSLALSLGAAEFLAKPVTQQMLLAALARCTQGVA